MGSKELQRKAESEQRLAQSPQVLTRAQSEPVPQDKVRDKIRKKHEEKNVIRNRLKEWHNSHGSRGWCDIIACAVVILLIIGGLIVLCSCLQPGNEKTKPKSGNTDVSSNPPTHQPDSNGNRRLIDSPSLPLVTLLGMVSEGMSYDE